MAKVQSPLDFKAVLDEAMDLNKAKETPVSVSVYIDDSAADDVIAYTRNAYASAAANARISIAYLSNAEFLVNSADDFAVIVAGRDIRVGARAAELRAAGVPAMVVTTTPKLVEKVANDNEHPIPDGDIVAPEVLTVRDSEAAEILASLPINAGPDQHPSYEHEAGEDDSPADEVEVAVEEVLEAPAEAEEAANEAPAGVAEDARAEGAQEAAEPEAPSLEDVSAGVGGTLRAAGAARGGLFSSLVGKATATAGKLRRTAAAAVAAASEPEEEVNPFLADVPEDLDVDCPMNEENTRMMSTRMGKWVIAACKDKVLPLSLAFPFVRRPYATDLVNITSVQNAGIGAVVFIPGADMPIMTLNQAKMLLQIAAAYGQPMTLDRAKELAAVVAGAFACRSAARQIVGLLPVGGWIVKGAIGYSGTLAMGRAAIEYFESGAGIGGIAGLTSKMTDAVQKAVATAKGEPEEPEEPEVVDPLKRAAETARRATKIAGAAAETASPVAQAAAKVAVSSFADGANSILSSLGGKR